MTAQSTDVALPLRTHTIFGACEAIGEDFGFNPLFLRIPLAASVLLSPMWAVVAYLALSGLVLASRLLFPKVAVTAVEAAPIATVAAAGNDAQALERAA